MPLTHSAVLEDEKQWRVSLPTCRVGCWKANLALIAAALFFAGYPQLPQGGGGWKKKSNVTQQLRFLSESPDIWDLNHIFRAHSINYQGHINIFTLELLYATDGWGICMKFNSCRNWQKIKYCFSLKYNQHQWTHQVWTTKALKVFFNRLITPSVKKPGRLLRGYA